MIRFAYDLWLGYDNRDDLIDFMAEAIEETVLVVLSAGLHTKEMNASWPKELIESVRPDGDGPSTKEILSRFSTEDLAKICEIALRRAIDTILSDSDNAEELRIGANYGITELVAQAMPVREGSQKGHARVEIAEHMSRVGRMDSGFSSNFYCVMDDSGKIQFAAYVDYGEIQDWFNAADLIMGVNHTVEGVGENGDITPDQLRDIEYAIRDQENGSLLGIASNMDRARFVQKWFLIKDIATRIIQIQ